MTALLHREIGFQHRFYLQVQAILSRRQIMFCYCSTTLHRGVSYFFFFKNTARPQGGGGGQSTRRALHSIHSFGAVTLWNGGLLVIVPKVPLLVAKGPVDKQRMRPRLGVRMLHMLAEENQQADCTLHLHHEQGTGDHAWCSSPKTVPVGPKCSAFQNSTSCGLDYSLCVHAQLLLTPWPQSVLDIASTQTNALASGSPPQSPKN